MWEDMSTQAPPVPPPGPITVNSAVITLLIPLVTIVGLIILIALHDLSAAAGLGLIGVLAGVHGGAAVATNSTGMFK